MTVSNQSRCPEGNARPEAPRVTPITDGAPAESNDLARPNEQLSRVEAQINKLKKRPWVTTAIFLGSCIVAVHSFTGAFHGLAKQVETTIVSLLDKENSNITVKSHNIDVRDQNVYLYVANKGTKPGSLTELWFSATLPGDGGKGEYTVLQSAFVAGRSGGDLIAPGFEGVVKISPSSMNHLKQVFLDLFLEVHGRPPRSKVPIYAPRGKIVPFQGEQQEFQVSLTEGQMIQMLGLLVDYIRQRDSAASQTGQ